MGIAPVTVFDSFSRSLSDQWGTSDSGHTWRGTTDADYDTYSSGGYGRIYVPANRGTKVAYIDVANNATQEVLVKVRWNVDTLTDHGPVLRRTSSSTYYYARIQDYYHEISLNVSVNGNIYELNRVPFVLNKNTYYWVRYRADSGLKLKIWPEGTEEPASWTITSNYFDGSNPPGAGDFGYYTRGTSSTYSVYLDTVYWYTLEDDEPGLPVTDTFSRLVTTGWGRTDTGHQWEGNLADDPTFYALSNQGAVSTSGYATITTTDNRTRNGIVGPIVADSEVVAAFWVNSLTDSPEALLGLRGDASATTNGHYQFRGYYARLIWGLTSFTLRKVPTIGSTSSQIGSTFTLPAAPQANERWWIKVQCQGRNIRAKAWKDGTTEPSWQIQTTDNDIASGRSFVRVQGASSATTNFRVSSFSHTVITTGNQCNTGSLTYSNVTDTGFTVSASYSNDNDADSSCTIQYRKQGDDTWSNATVSVNRSLKRFSATVSGLEQGTTYEVKATFADPDGVSGTNPLTSTVTTALNGLDTLPISLVADATTLTVTAPYANDANNNSTATYRYRVSPNGTWSAPTAMTANRSLKTFTATISGLENDTTYEVEVTWSDPDGVRDTNPRVATATTLGRGVRFASPTAITAQPADTSVTLHIYYDLDTNNNSSVVVQYRSIREALWTTISDAAIGVDRSAKVFRVIIPGLTPNLSYQVKATLVDPDGVVAGTDAERTTTFTTKGVVQEQDRRGKRYLFKVYDRDGTYLGTWHDAPEPQFGWHENGGISDLRVTLPRKLSNLNNDITIDFQNRVDVWAIDTTSEGLGVNLIRDSEMTLGSWTLTTGWSVDPQGGPDGSAALKFSSTSTTQRTVLSEVVPLSAAVPLVASIIAKARGGKLRMDLAAYDETDTLIAAAPDNAETVGPDWQVLKLEWTPPPGTKYVRMRVNNVGKGTMWFDKAKILQKELLVYRGRIESYTPRVDQEGESVEIEVLGLVSQLSDMYIRFLQYVEIQPTRDINEHPNQNKPPTDPANMMKEIIDIARKENPRCDLYYTSDSIKPTGVTVQYTFRNQQLVSAFDKIRLLCPPGWHWYIDPDGKVHLRGPEHVQTHILRLNVEVMEYENERSIRNLKNRIIVQGRKDEDKSEPDGFGTIQHIAFDQASIDKYGLRELIIRDANIKDPETAELVAEGRLEEYNRVEEAGKAYIPDEKDARFAGGALRGYNIEAFRPGDFVRIKNPISGDQRTYWDQFLWDDGTWDDHTSRIIPVDVPIKSINYYGDHVVLELSERQPSASGDFARLARWLRLQESDTGD